MEVCAVSSAFVVVIYAVYLYLYDSLSTYIKIVHIHCQRPVIIQINISIVRKITMKGEDHFVCCSREIILHLFILNFVYIQFSCHEYDILYVNSQDVNVKQDVIMRNLKIWHLEFPKWLPLTWKQCNMVKILKQHFVSQNGMSNSFKL